MKNPFLLFCLLILALASVAQQTTKTDMVIKTSGDILKVQVFKVTNSTISFRYPGEAVENVIPTTEINKIVFSSGREQSFSSNVPAKKNDSQPPVTNDAPAPPLKETGNNSALPVAPNSVAIIPPYFTQEGVYRKDLSDLAQSHIMDFMRKNKKKINVTPVDIRVINTRLRSGNIDLTAINSYDIAALAQKTGTEYILMFDLFKTFKERQQSTYSSAERNSNDHSVTSTATDKDAYNISAEVSLYKSDGTVVYQRRVKPLDLGPELTLEDDLWKGYINFLMKRTPLFK